MSNHHNPRGSDCVYEITNKVAEREGTDPTGLDPLEESIDPDALSQLVDSATDADIGIGFSYQGYYVTVNGNGEISVNNGSSHMLMN